MDTRYRSDSKQTPYDVFWKCIIAAFIVFWLAWLFTGCATTRNVFKESITDANGSTTTTTYEAKSSAAPFGKIDKTNHTWHYKFGDSEISTGQQAEGLDNTPQLAALQTMTQMFLAIIPAAIDAAFKYKTAALQYQQTEMPSAPTINIAPAIP